MQNKILIIGPFPDPISGVSIANKVMANGLAKKNWKVDIINSEYSSKITNKHGKFSINKFYFLKTYFKLYKILYSKIIYITIGQSFFGVLKYAPFILFSKVMNKTLVVHLHGGHLLQEYNSLKGIKKFLFKFLISKFNYAIVLSNSLRINFSKFLDESKIYELNNFFEDSLLIPKNQLLEKKSFKKLKVVFLSNLIESKGINILLEAIKILNSKGLILEVKIAGNKIDENDLSDYFNRLENVEYLGVVIGKIKKDLLFWSNVFCLPTFYKMEGQPISILEAMALGNLILTTKHAGILDICTDDNAVFCVKESVDSLVEKFELLHNDLNQVKQKSINNIDYSQRNFTEDNFINKANEILLKCIN